MKKKKTKLNKPKRTYWSLCDDVYECYVNLFVNISREDVEIKVKKLYKDYEPSGKFNVNWGASAGSILNKEGQNLGYFLWIKDFSWTIDNYASLFHEIFHLVNRILSERGVLEELGNDESYAYYISFWTKKIMVALHKEYN